MSARNWIRTAVAVLGLALVVHGTVQFLGARDAGAAPCATASRDDAGC